MPRELAASLDHFNARHRPNAVQLLQPLAPDFQPLVGSVERQAGVDEWSAGQGRDPDRPLHPDRIRQKSGQQSAERQHHPAGDVEGGVGAAQHGRRKDALPQADGVDQVRREQRVADQLVRHQQGDRQPLRADRERDQQVGGVGNRVLEALHEGVGPGVEAVLQDRFPDRVPLPAPPGGVHRAAQGRRSAHR